MDAAGGFLKGSEELGEGVKTLCTFSKSLRTLPCPQGRRDEFIILRFSRNGASTKLRRQKRARRGGERGLGCQSPFLRLQHPLRLSLLKPSRTFPGPKPLTFPQLMVYSLEIQTSRLSTPSLCTVRGIERPSKKEL